MEEKLIAKIIGVIFIAFGALILIPVRKKIVANKRCTQAVTAKCVDIVKLGRALDRDAAERRPVYEVEIKDTNRRYTHQGVTVFGVKKGYNYRIYINPNNFDEFYDPREMWGYLIIILFSIIFSVVGTIAIIKSFF